MDGSGTTFLRDTPYLSGLAGLAGPAGGGILYVEDFDVEPAPAGPSEDVPEPPPPPPLTPDDLESARQQGYAEGVQSALADALLVQTQLQAAALQSMADALGASRAMLERLARSHAEDAARTLVGVLQAAVPATMARHAATEIEAVMTALLPGLAFEPELRVRAHPDLADTVREALVAMLPPDAGVLSVAVDAGLAQGDVQVGWKDGGARRDCALIWDEIRAVLAPLGLPTIEELCCGRR
jgi:flagellar biosynthesis/type III secretory pathway protein FliH